MMRKALLSVVVSMLVLHVSGCSPDNGSGGDGAGGADASQPNGGSGGGGAGGADASQPEGGSDSITILHSGKEYAAGASYNLPDNNDPKSSNVALFSEQKDRMTIRNNTDGAITINSIVIKPTNGAKDEEFSLIDASTLKNDPLVLKDQKLAAGETFDFYIRFYPVYSYERDATLTVSFTDSKGSSDYVLNITGSGRRSDNAVPLKAASSSMEKVFGSIATDERVTGMAADAKGNTYFLAQAKEVPGYDGFYYDWLVGKVNADGTKGWFKIYSRSNAWEWSNDPGQNDETGGSPNAIVVKGDYVYVAGAMSNASTNNNNTFHAMKIKTSDGSIVWDKLWRPEWTNGSFLDRMGCTGYSLAVGGGTVYVVGTTGDGGANGVQGSNANVGLVGLSDADGSMVFQTAVDVAKGYNDRGYGVVASDDGSEVYVGGLTNGRGLVMKFSNANTANPKVAWAEKLSMGMGSNVYSLALDDSGVYLALDRRGATTYFSVAKVSRSDGSLLWAKTFKGGNGDSNNANFIGVSGNTVYAGGRIGIKTIDAQMGDGLVLSMTKDGDLKWAGVYYSGKGPDEIADQRVKSVVQVGNSLYVAADVYTGSTGSEFYRYDGYWYDGVELLKGVGSQNPGLEDYSQMGVTNIDDYVQFEPTNGEVRDASVQSPAVWKDVPDALGFVDAKSKRLNGTGAPTDSDLLWMKLDLK